MKILGHILGFPRIGAHRELKKALEKYWIGNISQNELLKTGTTLRQLHWKQQKDAGLDLISVGDFAWYDHVLTTSLMINNIPARHNTHNTNLLDTLFYIGRGRCLNETMIAPSEMKKWFNTNYHYIVPEFVPNKKFKLNWNQLFDEIDEAISLKYHVKPVLLGPVSYLWLGKTKEKKFDKLSLMPALISTYQQILDILSKKNIEWIQIEEPLLTLELSKEWIETYIKVYQTLHSKPKLLLTTYFDSVYHQLDTIKQFNVDGLHVDLVSKTEDIHSLHKKLPKHWVLSAGVINGRNIWKTDLYNWFKTLHPLLDKRTLWIGSSCSLLHSPIDLYLESNLNTNEKNQLSFALQKCHEITMLRTALQKKSEDNEKYNEEILIKHHVPHDIKSYSNHKIVSFNAQYQNNINEIPHTRNTPHTIRFKLQHKRFNLPIYPTTTIGSFPQTKEIRNIRFLFKNKKIDEKNYNYHIKKYIKKIISIQESLNLDVLVHGEPERNDMVEYFGENLNGFIFTQHGWIQSYGSRCVKPPIIFNNISRSQPITIKWINYAQSLTKKPVKGILTGPITIMSWSFLREDIKKEEIALQLALAIRDEVTDLENTGIGIIQIDEPALRESLPLKHSEQFQYLKWAIDTFNITISSVKNDTQIHTHICYSELDDIMHAIKKLEIDVITIEASRSEINSSLTIKLINNNLNEIGPGIYDIHSTNQPTVNDILTKLKQLLKYIPKKYLWINPDCGLKTRNWNETIYALKNMVSAAKILRKLYND